MTFLAPLALLWLALLIPLTLLYILKRRRREQIVGSTLLWEAALRDLRAERPFRRLLLHLALILQALALIAGAIALARPSTQGELNAGVRVALVVDVSPSMAALEADATRLELAQRMMTTLAEGLPPGGEMMIVEAGEQPALLAAFTNDQNVLLQAIESLHVYGRGADLASAADLAAERLLDAPQGSRMIVITDRSFDGELHLRDLPTEVDLRTVGSNRENTAITAADVRPALGGRSIDGAEIFVRLERFGKVGADVYVTASIDPVGVVASRRLRVNPEEPETVTMNAEIPPGPTGQAALVTVELTHHDNDDDALDLDDVVVIPSPGSAKLPVFLIGQHSKAIERVFSSDPSVELFRTTLDRLSARERSIDELDGLLVFVGSAPSEQPPRDSIVVIPAEDNEGGQVYGLELGDLAKGARITTWDEHDPRMRFVTLADVTLGALRPLKGPAGRSLIETILGPAAVVVPHHRGETTVLSFDPSVSGWSREPSFVIFFRNLLELARRRRQEGGIPSGSLGEPLRITAPQDTPIEVRTPSGELLRGRSESGIALVPIPAEPGAFHVDVGTRHLYGLRSLRSREESNLAPRGPVFTENRQVEAAAPSSLRTHRERWPLVAFILLGLLIAECIVATRRVV